MNIGAIKYNIQHLAHYFCTHKMLDQCYNKMKYAIGISPRGCFKHYTLYISRYEFLG